MTSGMKRKQSVAELWQEFCDNTSGHGLGAIIRNTGLVRIFWILMFLASLALSTYLVVVSIIEYFEFKATTVINEDFKESKIEFPSVTICNMNALDKHKLEKHGFHGNHSIALVMSQAVSPGKNIEWDHPPHKDHEKLYRNGSLAMSNLLYTYGRKIAEILKDEKLKAVYDNTCYFKRGSCPTWGFTETLTVYGLCYTFNAENSSHPHLHINRPGAGHGLILYMNIHEEHDVPTHHHHRGIKVLIYKRGTSVLSIHDEGITMLPGTFNVVGLTTMKVSLQKPSLYMVFAIHLTQKIRHIHIFISTDLEQVTI